MTPSPTSVTACRTSGFSRSHIASMQNTPLARAAATISRASRALRANAFSTSTGLPAFSTEHRRVTVLPVRGRDIDDVDIRVGGQLVVGAVGTLDAVGPGERCRPLAVTRRDRSQLATR